MLAGSAWGAMLWGTAAGLATLLGGLIALRLGGRIGIVAGLAAGVVLGVALFDLIPEAMALGAAAHAPHVLLAALALGFTAYMLFDRALSGRDRGGRLRMHLAAGSLTFHSFLDGLGIGLAFHVSPAVGGVTAIAVLAHDLSDGVNVVGLCLSRDGRDHAPRWLAANAIAPLAGVLVAQVVRLPGSTLALLLATFAGMFLYIGACELLPRSLASSPTVWTTTATLCGLAAMYAIAMLA